MLAKQKEFWKKKARDDYILANNEIERVKALEKNQRGWTKRVNESAWLLPEVVVDKTKKFYAKEKKEKHLKSRTKKSVYDDSEGDVFEDMLAEADEKEAAKAEHEAELRRAEEEKARRRRAELGFVGKILDVIAPLKRPKSGKGGKRGGGGGGRGGGGGSDGEGDGEGGEEGEGGGSGGDDDGGGDDEEEEDEAMTRRRRVRHADLIEKERKAKELIKKEERAKRFDFLVDSASQLRILQAARIDMNVLRMPAHHKITDNMRDGFEEYQLSSKERGKHMKKHVIWEDVIKDENEAMKFRVGGRHHHYLGVHRLHPLKMFPSTIEVLLPPGGAATDRMIPENYLLPNAEDKAMALAKEEEEKRQRRKNGVRIKKESLNMSRDPVRREERLQEYHYRRNLRHNITPGNDGDSIMDDNGSIQRPPVSFVAMSNSEKVHPSEQRASTALGGSKKKNGKPIFDQYGLAETDVSLPSFPTEQNYKILENERENMIKEAKRRMRETATR